MQITLEQKLLSLLRRLKLQEKKILVGTSGGPDSQALLHLLGRLAQAGEIREILAVGIDHGLRPEARSELHLASSLALRLGIRFMVADVVVDPHHGNLLQNARRARYAKLRQIAQAEACTFIFVAHTATDQAETILMRLLRGTRKGAAGMMLRRGMLVRPLLYTTRAEILTYLKTEQIAYAEDPSNANLKRLRSAIRHEIFPVLRRFNPQLEQAFMGFARGIRHDEKYFAAQIELLRPQIQGPFGALRLIDLHGLAQPLRQRLLHAWLSQHQVVVSQKKLACLADLLARDVGQLALGKGRAIVDRGFLWWQKGRGAIEPAWAPIILDWLEGDRTISIPGWAIDLKAQMTAPKKIPQNDAAGVAFDRRRLHSKGLSQNKLVDYGFRGARLARSNDEVVLSVPPGTSQQPLSERRRKGAEQLSGCSEVATQPEEMHRKPERSSYFGTGPNLCFRSAAPGDRFMPFGGQGSLSLARFLANQKIPLVLRRNWPVLAMGNEILWVVGLRRGNVANIDAETQQVLLVELKGTMPWP